jgi:hypothetical protein
MVTIRLDDAETTAQINDLAAGVAHPEGLAVELGRELAGRLKGHFNTKQKTNRNNLGGKPTNFWGQVSDSVNQPEIEAGGTLVRVSISHPAIRQKLEGGVIRAKRSKALTIPVAKEAYGTTVSDWENAGVHLFVIGGRGQTAGRGLLAAAQKGGKVKVLFLLRTQVNQKPDPTALPDKVALNAALVAKAREYVAQNGGGK